MTDQPEQLDAQNTQNTDTVLSLEQQKQRRNFITPSVKKHFPDKNYLTEAEKQAGVPVKDLSQDLKKWAEN